MTITNCVPLLNGVNPHCRGISQPIAGAASTATGADEFLGPEALAGRVEREEHAAQRESRRGSEAQNDRSEPRRQRHAHQKRTRMR